MLRHIHRYCLTLCAACLAIMLAMSPYGLSADEADEADAIRARLFAWTEAFNRGDAATSCELFSRSLVSEIRGQGEADYDTRCALITRALSDKERKLSYQPDIREVIVEGNLAVVRLTWTSIVDPGNHRTLEPGIDIFRKEDDGQWRIIRYMSYEME